MSQDVFWEVPSCAHHVIYITEFVLLIKIPPFYEVNLFNRKFQAHGGISKIFLSRPLFIFRPEMLKFHPYSILIGKTMVGFVIYWVLKYKCIKEIRKNQVHRGLRYRLPKVAHVSVPSLTSFVFWQKIYVVFLFTRQFEAEKILVLGIF